MRPFRQRKRYPETQGAPGMTDSRHPGQIQKPPASGLTAGGAGAKGSTATEEHAKTMGLAEVFELFGEKSVPLALIAIGLVIAGGDAGAEIEGASGWAVPEYIGTLSFAALLVILGCLERLVQIRSHRGAHDRAGTGSADQPEHGTG